MAPVQEYWYDDSHTIVLVEYEPGWTWEDFRSVAQRVFAAIRAEDHPVVIIHDNPGKPGARGAALPHLQWATEHAPANMPMTIVVYPSRGSFAAFGRMIITTFARISEHRGHRTIVVSSMEEALDRARVLTTT